MYINKLIKYYNYPEDPKFYILGIDSHNKLSNSSINNYQYYIYKENRTEMNIKKICAQSDIIMSSPIIIKDLLNYNIAYELYNQGYVYIIKILFFIKMIALRQILIK